VKGLTAAEATAKDGGVLIMCAELTDGIGSDEFYKTLSECKDFSALFEKFAKTPMTETIPAQWESQIMARIMANYKVIFVSRPEMKDTLLKMHMGWAANLNDALAQARAIKGENASITVVPNGVSVVVKRA
jgi:nickel-dependent lactate racemase